MLTRDGEEADDGGDDHFGDEGVSEPDGEERCDSDDGDGLEDDGPWEGRPFDVPNMDEHDRRDEGYADSDQKARHSFEHPPSDVGYERGAFGDQFSSDLGGAGHYVGGDIRGDYHELPDDEGQEREERGRYHPLPLGGPTLLRWRLPTHDAPMVVSVSKRARSSLASDPNSGSKRRSSGPGRGKGIRATRTIRPGRGLSTVTRSARNTDVQAEATLSAERLARFDQGGGGPVLPHGRHIDQDVTLADPRHERSAAADLNEM